LTCSLTLCLLIEPSCICFLFPGAGVPFDDPPLILCWGAGDFSTHFSRFLPQPLFPCTDCFGLCGLNCLLWGWERDAFLLWAVMDFVRILCLEVVCQNLWVRRVLGGFCYGKTRFPLGSPLPGRRPWFGLWIPCSRPQFRNANFRGRYV